MMTRPQSITLFKILCPLVRNPRELMQAPIKHRLGKTTASQVSLTHFNWTEDRPLLILTLLMLAVELSALRKVVLELKILGAPSRVMSR